MDGIMKALDHTVREIKREVNLKVLKVPEIEQKVLDATSDEPWGPHGSDMADIARATKNIGECQIIMKVLWQRLGNTDANWRHLYKALAVAEYLLANGTERAAEEIIDNSSQIAKLTTFEFVEPGGKDVGLNVRKKAEAVLVIVDDREKLQQAREKAASTRDKYLGVSSTGMSSYKSSAASFGSGTYSSGSRYGSTAGSRETASFKDRHTGTELSKNNNKPSYSSTRQRSKETTTKSANSSKLAKGGSKSMSNPRATPAVPSSQKGKNEDDGDEFNPRGSSTSAGTANVSSNNLDLFGPRLMPNAGSAAVPEIDLFAFADFQSAPLEAATSSGSHPQGNIDLFAGRPSFGGSATADMEFSVRGAPNKHIEQKTSSPAQPSASAFDPFNPSFAAIFPLDTEFSVRGTPSKSSQGKLSSDTAFDPLAGIPVKRFNGSNSSGVWSSSKGSAVTEPTHGSPGASKSSDCSPSEELNFGAFASHEGSRTASVTKSMNESLAKQKQDSMAASKPAVKKETFRGKSSIWADSLSRGLIDLNLAAPKMVDPSDARVVRRLSNGSEEKAPETVPWYMEAATGTPEFPRSTGAGGESRIF
ncbi:clathrin interactor EPSIN 1-like isoform X1 [Triticum urartu]|uniref:ENTH domain-containing protein n=1 Tax=Triticum urartu TaxID=4572 RepID=A0A8R7PTF6_TRIUA|nr:clathrin interactor EPSIN 1-like isoform X1 [Triticum urartu]XP_048564359.1 clathrin interactor EPSIN 1-like isoform X1 [Triticum urartu]